jgi:hypothetical protein
MAATSARSPSAADGSSFRGAAVATAPEDCRPGTAPLSPSPVPAGPFLPHPSWIGRACVPGGGDGDPAVHGTRAPRPRTQRGSSSPSASSGAASPLTGSRRGASGGPPLPPAVAPPASRRPPATTGGAPSGGPGAPSGSSCNVAHRPRPSPRGLPPATATRPAVRRRGAPGDPPPARRHPARLRRSSRTSRTRSAGVVRAVTWRMRHPAATSSRARSRSPWKASKPRWASQPSNSTAIRAPG